MCNNDVLYAIHLMCTHAHTVSPVSGVLPVRSIGLPVQVITPKFPWWLVVEWEGVDCWVHAYSIIHVAFLVFVRSWV